MKASTWAEYEHRVAIIDLGTNSVRFDVYAINEKGQPERLHREKRTVRLGDGLYKNGRLDAKAETRVLHALTDFSRMIHRWGVDSVQAFATSALREARPQERLRLVREVKRHCGISLKVISGQAEAQLIALGVLENEELPKGSFALIDIGGGSTEITHCRGRKILSVRSLRVGALRLQQLYLAHQPPHSIDLIAFRKGLDEALPKGMAKVNTVIGSSGTIRAISRIANYEHHNFNPEFLRELNLRMSGLNRAGLLKIPGMEEKRLDIILSGSLLFEELVHRLGAKNLRASSYSLRDGALIQVMKHLKHL